MLTLFRLETIDYRLLHAQGFDNYYSPVGKESDEAITKVWNQLTDNAEGGFEICSVPQGRSIAVSKAAKRAAEFTFKELCDDAKGSSDYAAVAKAYRTIILRKVPKMDMTRRDLLRRFILLIDTMYFHHRNVVIEAEVPLDDLFDIKAVNDETE